MVMIPPSRNYTDEELRELDRKAEREAFRRELWQDRVWYLFILLAGAALGFFLP